MNAYTALRTLMDGHHQGMDPYMGLHWAWWLVWLAIGAALISALARLLTEPPEGAARSEPDPDSPDEILCARYGRGEVSEDEFRERRRALRRSR